MPEVFLLPAHTAYMGHTCAREYTRKHICVHIHTCILESEGGNSFLLGLERTEGNWESHSF